MNDFPPAGCYAVEDPYLPGAVSYWILRGKGLEAWPTGSAGKYGPPRPPKNAPGTTVEQRRDEAAFWRVQLEEYRLEVLRRIAADPAGAASRWTATTERCSKCRGFHHAEQLPDSAAAGRGRAGGLLTEDARAAIVVALRRVEFPEALISEALAMPPGAVNRAARKAGIGAPLRTKSGARA